MNKENNKKNKHIKYLIIAILILIITYFIPVKNKEYIDSARATFNGRNFVCKIL